MSPCRETSALLVLVLALTAMGACREAREPAASAADRASFSPQPTPEAALRAYMKALELRVQDPGLTLYTSATRRLLAGAARSDRRQEAELRPLRRAVGSLQVRRRGNLAVIRFAAEHRAVAPYFFRRGDEGWMLDLATMSRIIVFDQNDRWALRSRDHEFAFAFDDGRAPGE